nr:Zn-ribbon domain-containing OB-fold protein [Candidatus Njordarchaeum guaymaensis]
MTGSAESGREERKKKTAIEEAKKKIAEETKGEPLEVEINKIIAERAERQQFEREKYFEVWDKYVMSYKYSYGRQSAFFKELYLNKRIMGAKCPKCKIVYCPPRSHCSECYEENKWITLSDTGTVTTSVVCWYVSAEFFIEVPYVCAYIKVDGADTSILQRIVSRDVERVRPGMSVRAVFREQREGKMSDFYFVPKDEYDHWLQEEKSRAQRKT